MIEFPEQKIYKPHRDKTLVNYLFEKDGIVIVDKDGEIIDEVKCKNVLKRLVVTLDILARSIEFGFRAIIVVNDKYDITSIEQLFKDLPKLHGGRIIGKEKEIYEIICSTDSRPLRLARMEKKGYGNEYLELEEILSQIKGDIL